MTIKQDSKLFLPVGQPERASQVRADELLAREVFEGLSEHIQAQLARLTETDGEPDFFKRRGHDTILLVGGRGTGKSTVLVNLALYLDEHHKEHARQVHVLRPIDPTQLEDDDDLFLNVVVAAVLADPKIAERRNSNEAAWLQLCDKLDELGMALEGRQAGKQQVGLDRLRAFVGSSRVAESVHAFFLAALRLLDKKLLVIPLDDVDTSLQRAFENLEVVRRYLVSPVVMPIVTGDLDLYHQVIWRDFFGRLSRDHAQGAGAADSTLLELVELKAHAKDLASEYERKVLPLQRRLQMPTMDELWRNLNIQLRWPGKEGGDFPLALLEAWLHSLLWGPVNGLFESDRAVPVPTVRALAQLLSRATGVLAELRGLLQEARFETGGKTVAELQLALRRLFQMPQVPPAAMQALEQAMKLQETEAKRRLSHARRAFLSVLDSSRGPDEQGRSELLARRIQALTASWTEVLLEQLRYEPEAGPAFLVLQARQHWNQGAEAGTRSVLDVPLFWPSRDADLPRHFKREHDLSNWKSVLEKLPQPGRLRIPVQVVLPFAPPELGQAINLKDPSPFDEQAFFWADALLHYGYYSGFRRASRVCIGRVIELVAASLVRNIEVPELQRILAHAPFHSAAAVNPAVRDIEPLLSEEQRADDPAVLPLGDDEGDERSTYAVRLMDDINAWRASCQVSSLVLSPWLLYCVVNRVFSQVDAFNAPTHPNGAPRSVSPARLWDIGETAFNSFWAAIAGFEKGQLLGLPEVVSEHPLRNSADFRQHGHYRQNIAPFFAEAEDSDARQFGRAVRSLTQVLGSHPVRLALRELNSRSPEPVPSMTPPASKAQGPRLRKKQAVDPSAELSAVETEAKRWLIRELGGNWRTPHGFKMLLTKSKKTTQQLEDLLRRLRKEHPEARSVTREFEEALSARRKPRGAGR